MTFKHNLLILSFILFVLKKSSGNPVEISDPNSYICFDEYGCNGCGIIEVPVNGKTCQVCTCGDQFQKIKNEIFPFTQRARLRTRASRTTPKTTTLKKIALKNDPSQFMCTDEYDCRCGIVQISANGRTCQVCSCGEQFNYFKQNVLPILQPFQTITRASRTPKKQSYVCFDEPECSCGTFKANINGKECTICLCGSQVEYLAKEIVPNLVVTRRKSLQTKFENAASFSCTEEYTCDNNCGIVQITTLKNTCQVCGCGDQYRYFMEKVYPFLKTSTKIVTRPSRTSKTLNQASNLNELTCYDETECSCKMLNTTLNGKTCKICKCGNQIETLIEKILPKMKLA